MFAYFMDPEILFSTKLVQIMYMIVGFFCIYSGVRAFMNKEHESRIPTGLFWSFLGFITAFSKWIPDEINGILVVIMCIPAVFGKVKPSKLQPPSREEMQKNFKIVGMKIFIPAFCTGVFSIIIAVFFKGVSSLLGSLFGTIVGIVLLVLYNRENKPMTFLEDGRRFLDMSGSIFLMPILLACLGAIYTQAGVGDAFANIFGKIIPAGNIYIGIVAYAVGMVLFTAIMGNAFAAITVLTVGIGVPFVINNGGNPLVMVTLAMTCGYCGTLLTPMAANFNIVPGVFLEVKNKYTIIKTQLIPAVIMLVFQIGYMCIMAK